MQRALQPESLSGDLCCVCNSVDRLIDLLICVSPDLYVILWLRGAEVQISSYALCNKSNVLLR
jgi:hypothetical protein